jgi:NADH:ubiquinone oxidoreductase subunit 4 (subunit M)
VGQLAWAGIIAADLVALASLVVLAGALARPQVREVVGPRTRLAAVAVVAAIELVLVAPPLPFAGFPGGLLLQPLAMVTGQTEAFRELFALLAVLAGTGVIFAAVYLLVATQKVFFGPIKHAENERLPDLTTRETLVLAPLVIAAVVMGVYPQPFIDIVQPSVAAYTREFRARAGLPALAETVPAMGLPTRLAVRMPPSADNPQPARPVIVEGR